MITRSTLVPVQSYPNPLVRALRLSRPLPNTLRQPIEGRAHARHIHQLRARDDVLVASSGNYVREHAAQSAFRWARKHGAVTMPRPEHAKSMAESTLLLHTTTFARDAC